MKGSLEKGKRRVNGKEKSILELWSLFKIKSEQGMTGKSKG